MSKIWRVQTLHPWLVLTIDGKDVTFEIRRVVASFELNKIPSCQVSIPLGVQIDTQVLAPGHTLAQQKSVRIPAKVYLRAGKPTENGLTQGFALTPDADQLIFDGDLTGIGYSRGVAGYDMVLHLTHWLGRLNDSSTLSESAHPKNPWQFSFNAGLADYAGGNRKHFVPLTQAQEKITSNTIQTDLWTKGILPWFKDLAKTDRLNVAELGAKGNEDSSGIVSALLDRITVPKDLPLKVKTQGVDSAELAGSIAKQIAVQTQDPQLNSNHMLAMSNTTFWDKLVGDLGPLFMFSIVPRPVDALVVPFVPGLQKFLNRYEETVNGKKTQYTISSHDVSAVNIDMAMLRPLRAVLVLGGQPAVAGANLRPNERWTRPEIGGMFAPRKDGMVLFRRAPAYLAELTNPHKAAHFAAGLKGQVKGNAVHPKRGQKAAGPRPKQVQNQRKAILDAVAQTLYINEILVTRQGQISGPFRLDICPGSTIKLQAEPELFDGQLAKNPVNFARYASVIRVTLLIDRAAERAGTAFHVSHVRTENEFNSDETSVAGHPLYEGVWEGANLVD